MNDQAEQLRQLKGKLARARMGLRIWTVCLVANIVFLVICALSLFGLIDIPTWSLLIAALWMTFVVGPLARWICRRIGDPTLDP